MKKFLLSLATVALAAGSAMADTATITMAAQDDYADFTIDNFNFKALKNSGSTAPTYNTNGADFRLYAQGTLQITAPAGATMTQVVFNISKQGLKRLAPITANAGTIAEQASGDETVTWTGEANDVIYTVGAQADYGSDGNTKAGQLDFGSIVITYTPGVAGKEAAGLSFAESSVSIPFGQAFSGLEISNPNNLALTWTSSDESVATVANGVVTVVAAGETVITANSAETADFYAGKASYTLTVADAAANIAEIIAKAPNANDEIYVNFPMTVGYVNGRNAFLFDAAGSWIQYFQNNTLKIGDVIPAGWVAVSSPYQGMPEIKGDLPAGEYATAEVTYPNVENVTNADVNKVVILKGVTFAAATPADKTNFTGTVAAGEITFRNNYTIASVEAGTYDVKCIPQLYSNALQVYPIEYTAPAKAIEFNASMINVESYGDGNITLTFVNDNGDMMALDTYGNTNDFVQAATYTVGSEGLYIDNSPSYTYYSVGEDTYSLTSGELTVALDKANATMNGHFVLNDGRELNLTFSGKLNAGTPYLDILLTNAEYLDIAQDPGVFYVKFNDAAWSTEAAIAFQCAGDAEEIAAGEYTLASEGQVWNYEYLRNSYINTNYPLPSSATQPFDANVNVVKKAEGGYTISFETELTGGYHATVLFDGEISGTPLFKPIEYTLSAAEYSEDKQRPGEFYVKFNDADWNVEAAIDFQAETDAKTLPGGQYKLATGENPAAGTYSAKSYIDTYKPFNSQNYGFEGNVYVAIENGVYNIVIDAVLNNGKACKLVYNGEIAGTPDFTSGVGAIEAAEADAEYFNLQGVRVAEPANGVFVKVVGGKAVKVVR